MDAVKISYLGHACFLLDFDGYKAVIDPYCDGSIPGAAPLRVEADAVYCSHQHGDHNAVSCVSLSGKTEKPYTVNEFEVPHDDCDGKKRGMNTVRIFEYRGIRIAHMGDIGRSLKSEEIALLSGVDCLMVPVGGFFTIDAVLAKSMADAVAAKVVIPMHYRQQGGFDKLAPVSDFVRLCSEVNQVSGIFELTKETQNQVLIMHN